MLFTLAADAQQQIKNFRSERIATIVGGRGPVLLPANGRLFVHLIPLSAFGQVGPIDLERAYGALMQFRPMGSMGMRSRFNLDGFINVRGGRECHGYTQIFRNGILEATKANVMSLWDVATILDAKRITDAIVEVLPGYFEGLQALDVPSPIVLSVGFEGVIGAKLGISRYGDLEETEPFPPVDPPLLPEVIVEDYGCPEYYARALKPVFDALWNAAGFARCTTYYDADGNWRPPT